MKKRISIWVGLIVILISSSCGKSDSLLLENSNVLPPSFPEIIRNALPNPIPKDFVLVSKTEFGLKKEIISLKAGEVNFEKNLSILLEAETSKPAWKGSFGLDSALLGDTLTKTYLQLEGRNIPVKKFELKYLQNGKSLELIQAQLEVVRKDQLSESTKAITCYFTNGKLKTYAVLGLRDAIGQEAIPFKIESSLNY